MRKKTMIYITLNDGVKVSVKTCGKFEVEWLWTKARRLV